MISWWESQPPVVKTVVETREIIKEIPVDVVREVEVIQYIDKEFTPMPFDSVAVLEEWVDAWIEWMPVFGGTIYLNGACENLAYAMMIDAVDDGYLVGTQIDPTRNHMMVVVPIYSENRYLFVNPADKAISRVFMGREWRIN